MTDYYPRIAAVNKDNKALQNELNNFDENQGAFLYLAELRRKTEPSNMFGGNPDEGYKDNIWIVAGDIGSIKEDGSVQLIY